MTYNVKPGDHATIINSAVGPQGSTVGKRVLIHADAPVNNPKADQEYSDKANALNDPHHYCPPSPYEKEHSVLGKIWPVTSLDGQPLADVYGNLRRFAEVPDQWLRKDPPAVPEGTKVDDKLDLPVSSS